MASMTKRSKEEVEKIWREYKRTGDPNLKNVLAEHYLPLVRYQAEKMIERLPHNVQIEDLCSSGIFGLFEALERFDMDRGVKFETYCVGRIRGAMLDELRAMDWVPRLTRARANKLQDTYARLEKQYGRAPTDVELARALDLNLEQLDALYREVSGASLVSLQRKPLAKDDTVLGVDVMEDVRVEGPVLESAKKDFVDFCRNNLSAKERYILMMYYFDDLTLKEIGTILGLSESRVCQLHAKLIARLREYAKRRCAEL